MSSASSADSGALLTTDSPEMSRTAEVIRSDSEVLRWGPPPSGARVRTDISAEAVSPPATADSRSRGSTSRSCQGCTGSSTRSPSRSH